MSTCALICRAAICAMGAWALPPAVALAQGPVRFRNVEVDVGPLRASEGDPTAAWVAETLPSQRPRLGSVSLPGRQSRRDPDRTNRLSLSGRRAAGPASRARRRTHRGRYLRAGPSRVDCRGDASESHHLLLPQRCRQCVDRPEQLLSGRSAGAGLRLLGSETTRPLSAPAPGPGRARLPSRFRRHRPPAMVGAGTDKTKPPLRGGPAVILVRPQLAVNIGILAPAMANFGLDDLRLVNPREGWPRSDDYCDVAYSAAAGASDVLDAARVFPSVELAVAHLNAVYAATARERGQAKAVLTPSAAMTTTAAAAGEKRGDPVRARAHRPRQRRGRNRRRDHHLPLEFGLRLADPRRRGRRLRLTSCSWPRTATGPLSTIPRAASPPAQREMLLAFFDYLEGKARRKRVFPAGDEEAGHAPQPAQHLSSDGADAAGRAHAVGGGGAPRRGPAGRHPDPQASAAEEVGLSDRHVFCHDHVYELHSRWRVIFKFLYGVRQRRALRTLHPEGRYRRTGAPRRLTAGRGRGRRQEQERRRGPEPSLLHVM